jgi:glycyl-tRNA synthetase
MYIVKKVIKGGEYYYLRGSKRVDGKVKAVNIAYLGKDRGEAEKKAIEMAFEMGSEEASKGLKNANVKEIDMAKENLKEEKNKNVIDKDFVSFVQEAGLIWGPEPEIYGGTAGFHTYGPLGKLLKNRVENSVRKVFNGNGFREVEGPTVMIDKVWKASGHLDTFNDPVIQTKDGKESYRVDKLLEEAGVHVESFTDEALLANLKKNDIKAPNGKELDFDSMERQSLMMKTKIAGEEASLRPETATVTYLPYLRFHQYFRKKFPFGVFQIGKAYRNEISPRQNVLRGREFTQAEGQIFIDPNEKNNWEGFDEVANDVLPLWDWDGQANAKDPIEVKVSDMIGKYVKSKAYAWCLHLAYNQFVRFGIPKERIRLRQHGPDEKAFYADDAWDIEVQLNNYGWTEVCGVHDRTDYDLTQHAKHSGQKLSAKRDDGSEFVPHVLEIAFGTDRPTYSLIDIFYDKKEEGDGKSVFRIPYNVAPIEVAVLPLMKKPELMKVAREIKEELEEDFVVEFDKSGSIGKRYLRAASAGIPFCVTIDYDSLENKDVTIRDRDSEKQIRVPIDKLNETIRDLISGKRDAKKFF